MKSKGGQSPPSNVIILTFECDMEAQSALHAVIFGLGLLIARCPTNEVLTHPQYTETVHTQQ